MTAKKTTWENVNVWYKNTVKEKGHYYHQNVVIPNSLQLLNLTKGDSLLDLACGQGVLSRNIPQIERYTGIDVSPSLVEEAKRLNKVPEAEFIIADVTKPLSISKTDYSRACIVLALQNTGNPGAVIKNAFDVLRTGGLFLIVLNHPAFRIPQNSSWCIDKENNAQYRRVDKYLSSLEIPIYINPSLGKKSKIIWTYHYSVSEYSKLLYEVGFKIARIEEWVSDKKSVGKHSDIENKSRTEFPLFMAILAEKIRSN